MEQKQIFQTGHLTDRDGAKQVARLIFQHYDQSNTGKISEVQAGQIIKDVYSPFQKSYSPNQQEIGQFLNLLDTDTDGKVDLRDIEQIALKYLVGQGFMLSPNYSLTQSQQFKQQEPTIQEKEQRDKEIIEEKLEIARKLFKKFDTDNSGSISDDEVGPLLKETFKNMGINYQPTDREIKAWMAMADTNKDGQVDLQEYENLIIRSLQRAGIKIK